MMRDIAANIGRKRGMCFGEQTNDVCKMPIVLQLKGLRRKNVEKKYTAGILVYLFKKSLGVLFAWISSKKDAISKGIIPFPKSYICNYGTNTNFGTG